MKKLTFFQTAFDFMTDIFVLYEPPLEKTDIFVLYEPPLEKTDIFVLYEPPREKTNNVVSDQV